MAGSHLSISYGLSLLPVHYELFMRQFAQFHTGWPLCCCLLTTRRVAEPRNKMALPPPQVWPWQWVSASHPSRTHWLFGKESRTQSWVKRLPPPSPAEHLWMLLGGGLWWKASWRKGPWESHWVQKKVILICPVEGRHAECHSRDTSFDYEEKEKFCEAFCMWFGT